MADTAIKRCSWFSAYYDINKSNNLQAPTFEEIETEIDVNSWITETIHIGDVEQRRYQVLTRTPTFYPTSSLKTCENCSTSENELIETSENPSVEDDVSATCFKGYAVAFCNDCRMAMCRKCCSCHGVMKIFKEHTVVPLVSTEESFIEKSIRTKHKRHQLKSQVKTRKSSGLNHGTNENKLPCESRKKKGFGTMNTLKLEAYTIECQDSVNIHKEMDETIGGLTRRIDCLQAKLESYDQVVDSFCQTLLSTQVSIVETGENIKKNVDHQVDEMLEKLADGAKTFCSTLEDKKEEIVGAINELVNSRNSLLQHKGKKRFDVSERDKISFLLKKVIGVQSTVMSKNREVEKRLDVNFKPLDLFTCCPNIGRLELFYSVSESNSSYNKTANFSVVIPFENEVRGIAPVGDELAIVTANCSTVYMLDGSSLELNSEYNVKDMKNPYDMVADKSQVLYITEWSDRLIHRVDVRVKRQTTKLSTKNSYTTLSLTPLGHVMATCPPKNKAREFDGRKSKSVAVQIARECQAGSGSDDASGGNPNPGSACHVVAVNRVEDCYDSQRYVVCTSDGQLALLDEKGATICRYGRWSLSEETRCDNANNMNISLLLHKPSHLAVDREAFVYVCDSGNDRIVLLDRGLKFVKEVLKPGTAGIRNPLRVCLDHDRSRLYVASTALYVFELF